MYVLFVFPTVAKGSCVFVSLPLIFMTVTNSPKVPDGNLGLEAGGERRWCGERGVKAREREMGTNRSQRKRERGRPTFR